MYDVFEYMLVVVVVGFDKNSFGQDNLDKTVETAAKYAVSNSAKVWNDKVGLHSQWSILSHAQNIDEKSGKYYNWAKKTPSDKV